MQFPPPEDGRDNVVLLSGCRVTIQLWQGDDGKAQDLINISRPSTC